MPLDSPFMLDIPQKCTLDLSSSSKEQVANLIIKGQGTVPVILKKKKPFSWIINRPKNKSQGFKLEITSKAANLYEKEKQTWKLIKSAAKAGLDEDLQCQYWFSLDHLNRRICYGKGELRKLTELLSYDYPAAPKNKRPDPYSWVSEIEKVKIDPSYVSKGEVWRDPVTIDPPLVVLKPDQIAMDDLALNNATVPMNLTPACQKLHGNISGSNFQLNTPDFPYFVYAIEASIRDKKGWCYQTLQKKSEEFGKPPNEKQTYLRITMGTNQGESPGIPYVMEIWPPGHYSPIHNHAGANAIIRVLSGEITVKLFSMLSTSHTQPFAEKVFRKDDVTWISPGLNQTHQLHNCNKGGPTCITIQCYMYGETDASHYEYFDFISAKEKIEQFTPNSDMSFLNFKNKMQEEWEANQGRCK
jgi:hypothetical protein